MFSTRSSGILLPISSLPSNYGIGSFSKEAYTFVDKLKQSKQSFWQILPLCPTSYGDSPYQSFSSFAGNPYFIDLERLISENLLNLEECEEIDFGDNENYVDYEKQYSNRFNLLKKAFKNWNTDNLNTEIILADETKDYCLFMAIKDYFNGKSWFDWNDDIKFRNEIAIGHYNALLRNEIRFYEFLQMKFNEQWMELKNYANNNGIKIIGDVPIYVALDSADCWCNPKLFQFDESLLPIEVAGCPPDGFSPTGQLWGNPLYNWDYHKSTDYQWWARRIKFSNSLYNVIRIDHFRGFDEYYSIPFPSETAENGHWVKGPNIDFFNSIEKNCGKLNIIAEDLGFLTDSVKELLEKSGFPGMKVIEFAFDSKEESDYLPHNYTKNCVVYTGTHDNDTLVGWLESLNDNDKNFAYDYLNITSYIDIHWQFIRLSMSSVSFLSITQMQDILGLDSSTRINTPSTLGKNWKWRMTKDAFDETAIENLAKLTSLYGRG